MIASILLSSFLSVGALVNPQNNFPNLHGGSGVLRSFSALPNEPTTFGLSLIGNFFSKDPFINTKKNSRNQFRVDGNYTFKLGIPIEVFSGFTFTYNDNSDASSATTLTTFFENVDLGFRIGHSAGSELFYLGGYGYVRGLSGTQALRNTSGASTTRSGPVVTGAAGFIETFDLSTKVPSFPLRQHLNVGYRLPNGNMNTAADEFNRFALNAFKYQAIVGSFTLETVYKYCTPFIETSMEYALGAGQDNVKFKDNRKQLTLGIKITPLPVMNILAAGDITFGGPSAGQETGIPRNPPYDIFIGLGFQTVGNQFSTDHGSIRGVVTDQMTGSPLGDVRVTVMGDASLGHTTDESGTYDFSQMKPGSYQAKFEKAGYESLVRSFNIREGKDALMDVSLAIASPKNGSLEIIVLDQETQSPIRRAIVSISGFDGSLATDSNGRASVRSIMEGEHSLNVEADGYLSGTGSVNVLPEKLVTQTIQLQKEAPPAPTTGACAGLVTNPDGTPLTARFKDTSGIQSPFATDPLTGRFTITLPPGSYEFEVEAENYLPQTVKCEVQPGQTSSINLTLQKPQAAVMINNKIVLPDAIYFEFGKADIKPESFPVLDQVVEILLKNEGSYQSLRVEGHTDDVGSDASNLKLSEKRSASVRLYLLKKGVKAAKVSSHGFGESKPIATNLTPEGRAENRRVEFNLVRNGE